MIAQASDPPPKAPKSVTRDSITDDASHINRYGSVPGVVEDVVQVIDHKAERALCRRFDFRILPVLALMCACCPSHPSHHLLIVIDLFNALDKGNLSNAETAGMSDGNLLSLSLCVSSIANITRSQFQTRAIQPSPLHLLRPICHLRTSLRYARQTLESRPRTPRPHVLLWFLHAAVVCY